MNEVANTLDTMHDQQGIVEPTAQRYIVRRLTPLECCRLQGFPDYWAKGLDIPEPTEEDIDYWVEAFRQFGKTKTRAQVAKWLKDPYSDSAEYKMWGNGIALPNAADVLCRVARYLHETET